MRDFYEGLHNALLITAVFLIALRLLLISESFR